MKHTNITTNFISTLFLGTMLFVFSGCKRAGCLDELAENYDPLAKKKGECVYQDFDRKTFLNHYTDNIITPRLEEYQISLTSLNHNFQTFKTSRNEEGLNGLIQKLQEVCLNWQRVSSFEFGVAENISFRLTSNTYPSDVQAIESNISTGSYDLNSANQIDASGLPALDYLLNHDVPSVILSEMSNENRVLFMQGVLDKLLQETSSVVSDFKGGYSVAFKNGDGTDAGSSLSLIVNNFNKDLEILKNAQLGIPLGKKTLGQIQPLQTQGYYGKMSRILMEKHMQSFLEIFKGEDGLGIDDYLDFLGAKYENEPLSQVIIGQIETCNELIAASSTPISEGVSSEANQLNELYIEVQKLIVLTKTDMPSALGVLITYQDNDGD